MTPGATGSERRDTRRRFEQWARNPACAANALSSILGVPMQDVARREDGGGSFGQSPFALARGQTFEAGLLRNNAERLVSALIEARVLPENANGLLDLRQRRQGGPIPDLDHAIEATHRHLIESANESRGARPSYCLIAGATLRIPGEMMLPEAVLVIDAVAVRRDLTPPTLIVGEVKTYPDRGGYTDGEQLATARAQAGVYAHGLDLTLRELGLSERLNVMDTGFLVLSRPGSNMPSVRANEDLRYQIGRARRGLEQLRSLARDIKEIEGDPVEHVRQSSTSYCETCVSFCERASICRERAFGYGDPAALGEEMRHWLGEVNLNRALELLDGVDATSPGEEDLLTRLRESGMLR